MSAWWRPDKEAAFSVGLTIQSDVLGWKDVAFLAAKFGPDWGVLAPGEPREHGTQKVNLDVHLSDERPESASANIVTASVVLDAETMAALIAVDPDIWIAIHARQELPDVGDAPSVILTPEALAILAMNEHFDIDQYGAGGHPVARWLTRLWHSRRFEERYIHRLIVYSVRDDVAPLDFAVDPDLVGDTRALREWRERNPGPVRSVVSEQMIRVPGEQGIGLFLDRELLRALADLGAPLELRFRTRFAL